jgi:RNA polymerase sigma-70 factor (ECF subfamily)
VSVPQSGAGGGEASGQAGAAAGRAAGRSDPELRAALRQAVPRLSEGQREVFVLHDVLGMRHEEIAEALACAVGTSKAQLHQARLRLRRLLSGEER